MILWIPHIYTYFLGQKELVVALNTAMFLYVAVSTYDNGNSICGFEWKTGNQEKQVGVIPNGAIQFLGDNIICRSTSYPIVGTWTDGDIIYNMGNGTPTLWIRINGSWIAK